MNILFICNEYPPGKSGGIGSVTRTLARALTESNHKIFVAGLYPPGYGEANYEDDGGIKVWRKRLSVDIGIIKNNYSYLDTAMLKTLAMSGVMRVDVARSFRAFNDFVAAIIDKYDIDIVEWPDFNDYFPYLAPDFSWPSLSVPLIIKFHGTTSYFNNHLGVMPGKELYEVERQHINRGDALVAVSKTTAKDYSSFYNIDREITTLHNPVNVDPQAFRWQGPNNTILYAAALTKRKGIYSLLQAWNLVIDKCDNAKLVVIGKGKHRHLSEWLTHSAKPTVDFRGVADHHATYQAMSAANAAIFPSYVECFAVAPLEAMACGCPVIYTMRTSGPEIISHGINGLLVDPDNIEGLADAILLLLNDQGLCENFSQMGRRTVEQRFNVRQSVDDHINFYSRVLEKCAKTKHCA